MTHVIETLWADQPGRYCCLSTKEADCAPRDYWFDPDDCDVRAFIAEHRKLNIYFCPHLFARRRRIKENSVLPRLLYADLDAVDPRRIDLEPTVAIQSSPGRYVGLWVTDEIITEQLSKRLTYALGADRTNWKLTQLLRLPGGINYKYPDKPRVKLMWDDGPTYKVRDLEAKLPQLASVITAPRGDRKASPLSEAQIFSKHKLNGLLRANLASDSEVARNQRRINEWLDNRPMQSSKDLHMVQRWRMHWKLGCALRDKGVPASESFILLRGTAFNKHRDDESVWKLVEKVYAE